MKAHKLSRGFVIVTHEEHPQYRRESCLLQESSAIGDYDDSGENPGSSFLWVGENHHLNRKEIIELIAKMRYWIKNKRLELRD